MSAQNTPSAPQRRIALWMRCFEMSGLSSGATRRPAVLHGVLGMLFLVAFVSLCRGWPTPYPNAERAAGSVTIALIGGILVALSSRRVLAAMLSTVPLLLLTVAPDQPALRAAVLPAGLLPVLLATVLPAPTRRLVSALVVGSTAAVAMVAGLATPECQAWLGARLTSLAPWMPESQRVDPEALILPAFALVGWVAFFSEWSLGARRRGGLFLAVLFALLAAQIGMRSPAVGGASIAALFGCWCAGWTRRASDDSRLDRSLFDRRGPWLAWVGLAAGILLTIAFDRASRTGTIGAVGFAASPMVSLDPPSESGDRSGLPFGLWRSFLDKSGVETREVSTPFSEEALNGLGVLVLINNNRSLDGDESTAIARFVARGGTLLVLADHTDVMGQMVPTNALMEPYGIQLRFDTAVPLDRPWNWRGGIQAWMHPLTLGLPEARRYQWGLGCSLALSDDAVPLLSAARGFSDHGNRRDVKRAGLGDLSLAAGERREAVVLAAEAEHGDGRVIVFGDTSAFQDTCFPRAYPFVSRVTAYGLGADRPVISTSIGAALVAALLGACLLVCAPPSWRRAGWLCVGAVPGIALGLACALREPAAAILPAAQHIAWIDATHGSPASTAGKSRWSVSGLERALSRGGWVPLHGDDGVAERLAEQPGALWVPAPRTKWSPTEISAVEAYLRRGGEVWVFAGSREYRAAPELLDRFDVAIADLPLGEAPGARAVASGLPLEMSEAWPVVAPNAEVCVDAWQHPVVVERSVGEGRLIVFGDAGTFLGDGLEQSKEVHEANQAFFQSLISCRSEGS